MQQLPQSVNTETVLKEGKWPRNGQVSIAEHNIKLVLVASCCGTEPTAVPPHPLSLPSSSQGWQSLEKWVGLLQLTGRNGRLPSAKLVLSIGPWVQSLFRAAEGMMVPKIPWPVPLAKAASLGRAASSQHSSGAQELQGWPGRAHAPGGWKWPGRAFVGGETQAGAEPQGTPPESQPGCVPLGPGTHLRGESV